MSTKKKFFSLRLKGKANLEDNKNKSSSSKLDSKKQIETSTSDNDILILSTSRTHYPLTVKTNHLSAPEPSYPNKNRLSTPNVSTSSMPMLEEKRTERLVEIVNILKVAYDDAVQRRKAAEVREDAAQLKVLEQQEKIQKLLLSQQPQTGFKFMSRNKEKEIQEQFRKSITAMMEDSTVMTVQDITVLKERAIRAEVREQELIEKVMNMEVLVACLQEDLKQSRERSKQLELRAVVAEEKVEEVKRRLEAYKLSLCV